jgi:hypothetical protein
MRISLEVISILRRRGKLGRIMGIVFDEYPYSAAGHPNKALEIRVELGLTP